MGSNARKTQRFSLLMFVLNILMLALLVFTASMFFTISFKTAGELYASALSLALITVVFLFIVWEMTRRYRRETKAA